MAELDPIEKACENNKIALTYYYGVIARLEKAERAADKQGRIAVELFDECGGRQITINSLEDQLENELTKVEVGDKFLRRAEGDIEKLKKKIKSLEQEIESHIHHVD